MRIVLFCLFLLSVRDCFAQPTPRSTSCDSFPLVAQALQAKFRLVYRARQTILWTMPTPGQPLAQIIVDVAHSGNRTRITYRFPPEAAGRVMQEDGGKAELYDPAHKALVLGSSQSPDRMAAAPATLALLRHNYHCLCLRREVINGLPCDVVAVRPRYQDGPSKQLWIDTVHHAILRTEEYDCNGSRRYVSSYETISFLPHLPKGLLSLPAQASSRTTHRIRVHTIVVPTARKAFQAAAVPGRLPAWCPWGYTLLRCAVVSPQPDRKAVLLSYGDGLKTITVLEERYNGGQPPLAELNRALARYGQQAWVRNGSRLRTIVQTDLSMPQEIGEEMLRALSDDSAGTLAQGLARDFGIAAAKRGARLRQRGWGYEQISALCLGERSRPQIRTRLKPLLDRNAPWPQIAAAFGSGAESLEIQSRRWVAATLAKTH